MFENGFSLPSIAQCTNDNIYNTCARKIERLAARRAHSQVSRSLSVDFRRTKNTKSHGIWVKADVFSQNLLRRFVWEMNTSHFIYYYYSFETRSTWIIAAARMRTWTQKVTSWNPIPLYVIHCEYCVAVGLEWIWNHKTVPMVNKSPHSS